MLRRGLLVFIAAALLAISIRKERSMRITRAFIAVVTVLLAIGYVGPSSFSGTTADARPTTASSDVAVGPQYDTTHIYVAPIEFDRFVDSLVATFGARLQRKASSQ